MSDLTIEKLLSAYDILSVSKDAVDDVTIRQSYLTLAQRYSPDKHPDRFQLIRSAYEKIATEEDRLAYELFECPAFGLLDCINQLTKTNTRQRPTRELLCEALFEAIHG